MKIGKVIFAVAMVLVITALVASGLVLNITARIVTEDVRINEIMYNPSTEQGSDTRLEWLELYNNDTIAINISGWTIDDNSITGGVMQPGGYVVLARNKTAFENYYGALTCPIIEVTLSLTNDENTVVLKNAVGAEIDNVTYIDDWGADGNGRTLELNETGRWEESLVDGGTPCEENSVSWEREPPIVINATATPSTIAVNTETTILHVDVADRDSNISTVTIDLSPIGMGITVMTLVGDYTQNNLTWLQFEHETNASIAGTFNLTVNATDTYGNYNDTERIELTVIPSIVKVEPASQTVLPGQSFSVNVTVEDVTDMASDGAILHFDPTAMQATGITAGVISSFPIEDINNTAGTVTFGYALSTGSFSGSGPLATIEFAANASAEGTFNLNLTDVDLRRPDISSIPTEVFNGTVTISGPPALVKVIPETQVVSAGSDFHINVTVENVTNMAADGAILHFDPTAMQATGITAGVISTFPIEKIDNVNGTVTFAYALATGGFSGNGTLATIEFTADASAEGEFNLNLTDVELMRPDLSKIPTEVFNGTVTLIPFNITITLPENRTYASKCVRLSFTVEPEGTALDWIGYSLDGGANVTIAGSTTVGGLSEGGHSIVVYARDSNGNMAASNTVFFTIHPADINGDCKVYVSDLLLLAQAYNSRPGDANWNEDADLDCSNRVYTADLLILAQNYNKMYPAPC